MSLQNASYGEKKSTVDAKTTKTKTIFDHKSGLKFPLYLKGIQQSNQS